MSGSSSVWPRAVSLPRLAGADRSGTGGCRTRGCRDCRAPQSPGLSAAEAEYWGARRRRAPMDTRDSAPRLHAHGDPSAPIRTAPRSACDPGRAHARLRPAQRCARPPRLRLLASVGLPALAVIADEAAFGPGSTLPACTPRSACSGRDVPRSDLDLIAATAGSSSPMRYPARRTPRQPTARATRNTEDRWRPHLPGEPPNFGTLAASPRRPRVRDPSRAGSTADSSAAAAGRTSSPTNGLAFS